MKDPLDSTVETKIAPALLLRVYQRATLVGEAIEPGVRRLNDLTITADPDGYTISISDGVVTARLMFHNKIAFEGANGRRLTAFRNRLEAAVGCSDAVSP